ncbi:MAG: MFS transporter [Candidatus Thorarchaeota archaeon]
MSGAIEDERHDPSIAEVGNNYRSIELVSYFLFAVGPLVGNAVLVLLGSIATDFTIDPTAVLVALSAFMFPFAIFQLMSGAISDVYGRVPVIMVGLVTLSIGLLITASSTTLALFAMGNLISGVGFGFVNPVLLALLSDCANPEDIPKRMGIASALASFSVGLGPFIAGQMVSLGWQSYYFLFVIVVFLGLIAISAVARPPRKVHDDSGVRTLISNLRGELRNPVVLLMLVVSFMISLVYLGSLVWTSRGLTGAIDPNLIGLLLLGGGISGAVAGFLIGSMIQRFGYIFPIVLGFATLFSGVAAFIFISDITLSSSIPYVLLSLVLVGCAGGLLLPIMITFSQIISPEHRGVLAGAVTFSFFLGSALIPTIFEPLFIIGMGLVYIGILVISIILVILFGILYRKIKPMIN